MSLATGAPTWIWPEWRKAPVGLRVEHERTGAKGTYLGPARNKHNGAKVRWDRVAGIASRPESYAYVVSPARDLRPVRIPAWELIGFDGTTEVLDRLLGEDPSYAEVGYEPRPALVRVVGGRTLYESVGNDGGRRVRLSRLDTTGGDLRAVVRYVDADAVLEIVEVSR